MLICFALSSTYLLGPPDPHLLDVRHAAGQLAVVVVVQARLDCGQVHGLRHNLEEEDVRLYYIFRWPGTS